ncbi:putative CDP-alcohol phosphatidyltransferase class-I family protein [Lyophyllum shimeji]|uniref:CDP-diacylglycerol--serine O-phosphatidyltransferase n=1 Tax=Lyophyllum shimeji TaxID=47721 RepID=A0A9P3PGG1_LYOSH|nr:putative CDP-alcohol phosphatidyltransferase class-I family protein [Lyophyllum shimeji]
MSQRKSSTRPNVTQLTMSQQKADALHQYQDTDGHFSLVRNFRLADLVTIMNGVCGSFSIFSSARYLITNDIDYLWSALAFPLAGLMFDFLDGKVARWRRSSSMLGQELDSLADLISFGVAPSLLAFVVGLRTYLDTVVLTGFMCCGLARLARFNATVALVPKDEAGKAKYFEGLPIPSSLGLVSIMAYWAKNGWIEGKEGIPWGTVTLWGKEGGRGELHVFSFVIGFWAAAMDMLLAAMDIYCRVPYPSSKTRRGTKMVSTDDVQRLFLQAIFSRGILSGKLAQTLWAKCVAAVQAADPDLAIPYSNSKDAWDAFVTRVNRSLDSLDLEFRHLHDENTGKEMYALVNRKGDEIAQMATEYTPAEIAYFKAIIELIMLAPRESFSVSSTAALREVSAIRPKTNMSKTQAEVVLGSFVAKGWLVKSKQGRYSLSTRSLLELLPYLKSTYPDEIVECTICMEILTRGIACHTNNCKTRMHYHCFTTFRRRHNACPSCRTEWPAKHSETPLIPVGEGAARPGDEAKRRARSEDSDADEEDYAEEDEPRKSQQRTQRSQRPKTGKTAQRESMNVDDDADDDFEYDPVKKEKASQPTRRSTRK